MSKPKVTYAGREAAVLRQLNSIALTNGLHSDERSPTHPDWVITGKVTIVIDTPHNLVDEHEWHYGKPTFGLRENKGPIGRVMTHHVLSFDEADLKKAQEVIKGHKIKQEEDAKKRIEWTEFLMQPCPHLAEEIVNFINVRNSEPIIRLLAKLDQDTLQKVRDALKAEDEAWTNKVTCPAV